MKKFLALFLSAVLMTALCACKTAEPPEIAEGELTAGFLRTAGADDYGRAFLPVSETNENLVGIFYFLWLNMADGQTVEKWAERGRAEYTLTGETDPDTGESVKGNSELTYWGEPMYGYYQVEDEWVVRKHVELFIHAGIDFIAFDATNNSYYEAASRVVLDVLLEYQRLGYNVPKALFMTNSSTKELLPNLYRSFYRNGKYDSVMFKGNGEKPWVIGSEPCDDADVMDAFYFKRVQWPNASTVAGREGFPWMDWQYPQKTYRDAEHGYSIMNVSVFQHIGIGSGVNPSLSGLCSPTLFPTLSDEAKARLRASNPNLSLEEIATTYYNANRGRGYSQQTRKNSYDDALKNINFEEQFQTVLEDDEINLVFVTGWNEWGAQRQSGDPKLGAGYGHFVDTFNMEFSRDIEMMKGGFLDNCYLQLVRNVRAFKGEGEAPAEEETPANVDLFDLANWEDKPSYADLVGETIPRAHQGAGSNYYRNDTGRNDIREVRVAHTADSLWFLVAATEKISPRENGDTRWMNLFLGFDGAEGGWNGLQYVLNRSGSGKSASVEKIENGTFVPVGNCETRLIGKYLIIKADRALFGAQSSDIRFQVTDNLQKDFDVTEFYTNGDCAPIGRIRYGYRAG